MESHPARSEEMPSKCLALFFNSLSLRSPRSMDPASIPMHGFLNLRFFLAGVVLPVSFGHWRAPCALDKQILHWCTLVWSRLHLL